MMHHVVHLFFHWLVFSTLIIHKTESDVALKKERKGVCTKTTADQGESVGRTKQISFRNGFHISIRNFTKEVKKACEA
jgi:hypothetical protein